ncbi:MAG: hypothetical protein ACXVHM_02405 [Methanobacterium sp.]
MNNIFTVALGVFLVIVGFYAMSFGFSTPPNISFFFTGLILTVFGGMVVIIYGSQVEEFKSGSKDKKTPKISSTGTKDINRNIKPESVPEKTKIHAIPKKIQPVATKKLQESSIKKLVTDRKEIIEDENKKQNFPKEIKPKRIPKESKNSSNKIDETITDEDKFETISKEIKSVSAQNTVVDHKTHESELETTPEEIKDVSKDDELKDKPKKFKDRVRSPFTRKKVSGDDNFKEDKPNVPIAKNMAPVREDKNDEEFVKNRLSRLKENTLRNAKDIENLIEERLDSFKGTLDHIKPESKDPSIIWSFDANDVQKTMQNIILKADKKILMMYPWIRNVDVSVLKRFMETDSRMILQEASLDDDASVELIKLLMENNVKIRTMPNVHTVTIVSDENNGLIISTDPIYESYEVGVIYKDQKSIEEIERMFDEAWNLSQEIDLS